MSCSSKGCPIRVTDLGWGPKSSHFLVRDVSFALDAGDRLAIVGPNGAGKTTLLRCLYRGVSPLEGRVEVDGQDIWSMSARQVARRVAVVLQEMPGEQRDVFQPFAQWRQADSRELRPLCIHERGRQLCTQRIRGYGHSIGHARSEKSTGQLLTGEERPAPCIYLS